jgi:hypothetical protein
MPRYLVEVLANADAVSGSVAGSDAVSGCVGLAGAGGAFRAVGIAARSGSPASGTLPEAAIARGCRSKAASPVQPV